MPARRYQDLIAWQKARLLVQVIYQLSGTWPSEEKFGLVAQIRRAAVSVMSNIAEGAGRGTDADFARFLRMAYGSLMETESQLYAAVDLQFANEVQSKSAFQACSEVGKVMNGLLATLKRDMDTM